MTPAVTYRLTTWVHAGGAPGVIHKEGTEVEFVEEAPDGLSGRWLVRRVKEPVGRAFVVMVSTLRPVSIVEQIADLAP